MTRNPPGQSDVGRVGVIEGLYQDDLISRVDQPERRSRERFGATGRDRYLGHGVEFSLQQGSVMFGQGGPQLGNAGTWRILVVPPGHRRLHRRFLDEIGAVPIGKPLTEIDRSVFAGEIRHLGENGHAKGPEAIGHRHAARAYSALADCSGSLTTIQPVSGCGAAWLARVLWEHEVVGSNPTSPTRHLQ